MSLEMKLRSAFKGLQIDLEAGTRGTENSWSVFGARVADAVQDEIRRQVRDAIRDEFARRERAERSAQRFNGIGGIGGI